MDGMGPCEQPGKHHSLSDKYLICPDEKKQPHALLDALVRDSSSRQGCDLAAPLLKGMESFSHSLWGDTLLCNSRRRYIRSERSICNASSDLRERRIRVPSDKLQDRSG